MEGGKIVQDGKGDKGNEGAGPRSQGRRSSRFEVGAFDTKTTNLDSSMLQQGDDEDRCSL
jgi:hypothetical protein